jgi:hypothetical protein
MNSNGHRRQIKKKRAKPTGVAMILRSPSPNQKGDNHLYNHYNASSLLDEDGHQSMDAPPDLKGIMSDMRLPNYKGDLFHQRAYRRVGVIGG